MDEMHVGADAAAGHADTCVQHTASSLHGTYRAAQ